MSGIDKTREIGRWSVVSKQQEMDAEAKSSQLLPNGVTVVVSEMADGRIRVSLDQDNRDSKIFKSFKEFETWANTRGEIPQEVGTYLDEFRRSVDVVRPTKDNNGQLFLLRGIPRPQSGNFIVRKESVRTEGLVQEQQRMAVDLGFMSNTLLGKDGEYHASVDGIRGPITEAAQREQGKLINAVRAGNVDVTPNDVEAWNKYSEALIGIQEQIVHALAHPEEKGSAELLTKYGLKPLSERDGVERLKLAQEFSLNAYLDAGGNKSQQSINLNHLRAGIWYDEKMEEWTKKHGPTQGAGSTATVSSGSGIAKSEVKGGVGSEGNPIQIGEVTVTGERPKAKVLPPKVSSDPVVPDLRPINTSTQVVNRVLDLLHARPGREDKKDILSLLKASSEAEFNQILAALGKTGELTTLIKTLRGENRRELCKLVEVKASDTNARAFLTAAEKTIVIGASGFSTILSIRKNLRAGTAKAL